MVWENSPSHICRGGDFRGLAFCCPPVKYCPLHKAIEVLGITPDEFSKLKEDFGKKTRLGEGKNTCFGSLVWCCKITKPCPFRDSEMLKIGMGEDEYMELKQKLSEEILKSSKVIQATIEKFVEKGIPREIAEKAILDTGDLVEAYKEAQKIVAISENK
ncbi:methanogenesis marker 9 domain-containing protein [Methanococcus voltae]|uniref:Methanogenesis marker protein 9 n=1 Tax=Methanococcus voltae (strain ATCC BAA-1334 / A3) TaxID=456320 RepID=D7DV19_METV3|nr:methanogenesis marker 9 domain-containing protein [Methanococcus voltae]MCS3900784.1 putative methanogenesis marker domain 9 [Methanococcus voltae]